MGGKPHMSNREELKQILQRAKETETDRLKEEIALLKTLEGKTRIAHVFEYYKFHVIILVIVLYFVASGVWNIVRPPAQPIITIAWMGGLVLEEQLRSIENALIKEMIDEENLTGRRRQTVEVLSFSPTGRAEFDMAMLYSFAAQVSISNIDIFIGYTGETMDDLLENVPFWTFKNVEHIVESLNLPREYILYIEEPGWDALPHALHISGNPFFEELGIITDRLFIAVLSNTQREEAVLDAIRVIFGGG